MHNNNYHHQKEQEILDWLASNKQHWLSESIATAKLKEYGKNELQRQQKISIYKIRLNQFTDPLVIVLIGATIISIILHEYSDALVISMIIMINAILGFFQEYKAEKSIAMLSRLTSPVAKVIRNGKETIIPASWLVPWDIVLLETGDKINADMRLLECIDLSVDESILTGESKTVQKSTNPLKIDTIIAERSNMVFAGTMVARGKWIWIVVYTGMKTQLGNIAYMVQTTQDTKTPLQQKLQKLWILLGIMAISVCIGVMIIGILKWESLIDMLFVAISLAVSAIPEWLPAVVTIILAIGVQKMYKHNALIRKLKAVETLWSTTIICTDKTGTITQNSMSIVKLYIDGKIFDINKTSKKQLQQYSDARDCMINCNDAHLPNIGDPTELALLHKAAEIGMGTIQQRINEIPFTSENKYMVTIHKQIGYIKGSPEIVLNMCDSYQENGKKHSMTLNKKNEILQELQYMTADALRVLAIGYNNGKTETYTFIGLIGMIDPPRKEVKQALQLCKKAGIKVIMITGDNKDTAIAIGKLVGITGKSMTGSDIDLLGESMTLPEWVHIFARVNPAHKVKILQALQTQGHVVAMTGDGVNDAPALKKADVGIAMSTKGTDVAREAADMILVDDNFASIVSAIEYWRIIYSNIKKSIKFMLAVNFDEILVVVASILAGMPVAMLPIQILWMNLVTDSLPTLALGREHAEDGIMQQHPRSKTEHILSGSRQFIIITTLIWATSTFILFRKELQVSGIDKARTVLITASIIFELCMAFAARSDKHNIRNIKTNKYLIWAVILSIVCQILAIYTPLHTFLHFTPLTRKDWVLILAIGISGLVVFEIIKFFTKPKLS